MTHSTLAFVAPPSAQAASAKSSPALPSRKTTDDAGFADALAKSSEQASNRAESVATREQSSIGPGTVPEKADASDTPPVDKASGDAANSDALAALIAQVSADSLPAVSPIAGHLAAITPSATLATTPGSNEPPITVHTGPHAPNAARTSAVGVDYAASAKSELVSPVDAPTVTMPALATIQIADAGVSSRGMPRAELATEQEAIERPAIRGASNLITTPAKVTESQEIGALGNSDELHQLLPNQADAAAAANPQIGNAPHAGAHGVVSAGSTSLSLVPTHLENPSWSKDFGQHIIRLAVDGQPAAEIHLNPPNLGPILVTIEIKGQTAALQFSAEHLQTREALENALPRLREIFATGDLTLSSASVTSQSSSHSSQYFSGSAGHRFDSPVDAGSVHSFVVEDAVPAAIPLPRSSAGRSRVDLFA